MSHSLIDRYDIGGAILAAATSDLTREQERALPGPGDWSIATLVAHVLDADLVFAERMKRVIAEDKPTLLPFDENAWINGLRSADMHVEEGVNLFAANRRWMSRVLRGCSDADFARYGEHPVLGKRTLAELLAFVVGHLDHHLRFLYAKRANLGAALAPRYSQP